MLPVVLTLKKKIVNGKTQATAKNHIFTCHLKLKKENEKLLYRHVKVRK